MTALVGDNGAGKSTLVKCVSGIYPIDAGEFLFDGQPVTIHSPRDAAALGIEVVYQDLALCDNLDIVQNMFLGREKRSGIVLDEPTMEQMAARDPGRPRPSAPSSRSASRSPASPAASARPWPSPRPCCGTASWSSSTSRPPRSASRRPPRCSNWSAGSPTTASAVVLISHNMNDVFAVSDRIAALYLGQMVAQVKTTDVTHAQVVELITAGRSGDLGLPARTATATARRRRHRRSGGDR